MPTTVLEEGLGNRPGRRQVLRLRQPRTDGQSGRGEHHPGTEMGGVVCETVAHRADSHARWQGGRPGPGDPAGFSGLTRFGQPVHALRLRLLAGTRVPDRGVRAVRRRCGGALRHAAAGSPGTRRTGATAPAGRAATTPGQNEDRVLPGPAAAPRARGHVVHVPRLHVHGAEGSDQRWQEHLRRVPARRQPSGSDPDGTRGPPMADPLPHHRGHRGPRRVDQPRRSRLDDLLREVLPDRTRRPPATHQHLPGALGPAEVQTAAVVQEGQTMVARALAQAIPTLRPLGLDDRVLDESDETSGMTGDCHVPFCGSPGVRSPRATRRPSVTCPHGTGHGRPATTGSYAGAATAPGTGCWPTPRPAATRSARWTGPSAWTPPAAVPTSTPPARASNRPRRSRRGKGGSTTAQNEALGRSRGGLTT